MSVISVIPARGGSKGIPRKNIRVLAGKPLVAHAIEAALSAKNVDRVIVSTDDEEIAVVARKYGAEVFMRPVDISGDKAASEEAVLHVLSELKKNENYIPDIVLMQQCTVPHTKPEHLDMIVDRLKNEKFDSCFSCIATHCFLWGMDSSGNTVGINHDHTKPRVMRQDLPEQVAENGAVYAFRTGPFLDKKNRFCGKTGYSILDMDFLDIDTEDDWKRAESFFDCNK